MEENEEFDSGFNSENIPITEEFWNYMEDYWHNNREFPESTESQLGKKADLVGGKVPATQLPSYVDDVLEFDAFENLPNPGEKGKIYLITSNNTQFRWSGSEYIQINSDENLMTLDTEQSVTGKKYFITSGGSTDQNNKLIVASLDHSLPGVTFYKSDLGSGNINFNEDGFNFVNAQSSDYINANAKGFKKGGSNDSNLLTGGGGHKPISDFAQSSDLSFFHKRDASLGQNNASDTHTNQTWFDYNWAGTGGAGSAINFSGFGGSYSTELFGSYNIPDKIAFRTRQGDTNTWNEPRWLWHDKNFNPNDYGSPNNQRSYFFSDVPENSSVIKIYIPSGSNELKLKLTSNYGNSNSVGLIEVKISYGIAGDWIFTQNFKFDTVIGNTIYTLYVEPTIHWDSVEGKAHINVHKFFSLPNQIYLEVVATKFDGNLNRDSITFVRDNLATVITGTNEVGYWEKYEAGLYRGILDNSTKNFSFVTDNGHASKKINVGGLLVSNAYQDEGLVPADGIYSKGNIKTAGQFIGDIHSSVNLTGNQVINAYHNTLTLGNPSLPVLNIETADTNLVHYRAGYGSGVVWDAHNFNPDNKVNTGNSAYGLEWDGLQTYLRRNNSLEGFLYHSGNFNPANYATDDQLSDYLTLNTSQVITGNKFFAPIADVQFSGTDLNHVKVFRKTTGNVGIVSGHEYTHYGTSWKVGNKRGGSTNSLGLSFQFSTDYGTTYADESVLIQADGNILSSAFGSANQWIQAYNWGNHAAEGYATQTQLSTKVNNAENVPAIGFTNGNADSAPYFFHDSGVYRFLATQTWVTSQGYLTSSNLNGYATESWVSANFPNQTLSTGAEGLGGQTLTLSNGNAVTITNNFITSPDGTRNPDDIKPNTSGNRVRFDFANASSVKGSGNYAGVMTYAPWDGTTASTGDSSYQLAFANQTGINGEGIPMLKLRKGIDDEWSSGWYKMWSEGDFSQSDINNWNYLASHAATQTWTSTNFLSKSGGTIDGKVKLNPGVGVTGNNPVIGNGDPASLLLSGDNGLWGTSFGHNSSTGDLWIQPQRFDGGSAVYNINLAPLGGNVTVNNQTVATQSWVQSKNYTTPDFVEESVNQITAEHINPDYPVFATSKINTIIITEEFGREYLELDRDLIPERHITVTNLAPYDIDVRIEDNSIDTIRSGETTDYYITSEKRLIKKGSFREASFLN